MKGQKLFFVDIGSSSVKVYLFVNNKLQTIAHKSISFKDGFISETGFAAEKKEELFAFLNKIKKDYPGIDMKAYGTALFRKMVDTTQETFKKELSQTTSIPLTILTHDQENEYLEKALLGKYTSHEPVLLVNIGGGSTELVLIKDEKVIDRKNVAIGVGSVLNEFLTINDNPPGVSFEKIIAWAGKHVPPFEMRPKLAICTGGELIYMKIARYHLVKNSVFSDPDHPSMIEVSDYRQRNHEVFTKVTLKELESLMPDNPTWMHGARAYNAISQAICKEYDIETIIPSDSNLMNGIIRMDYQ